MGRNTWFLIRNTRSFIVALSPITYVSVPSYVPFRGAMFYLACTACAWQSEAADLSACPDRGVPIDLRYAAVDIPPQNGMPDHWRYGEHLPIRAPERAVSLGERGTPLLRWARLGGQLGVPGLQ